MSGPQFFQTGYGRQFFDHQLPALIKGINRLAEAIEEQNKLNQPEPVLNKYIVSYKPERLATNKETLVYAVSEEKAEEEFLKEHHNIYDYKIRAVQIGG